MASCGPDGKAIGPILSTGYDHAMSFSDNLRGQGSPTEPRADAMSPNNDAIAPKSRRRSAVKASSRPDAERVKLTLYLDADLAKRFGVHAMMTGMDQSELLAEMVKTTCKRFVVSDRQTSAEESAA